MANESLLNRNFGGCLTTGGPPRFTGHGAKGSWDELPEAVILEFFERPTDGAFPCPSLHVSVPVTSAWMLNII